jgi:endonuclease-3
MRLLLAVLLFLVTWNSVDASLDIIILNNRNIQRKDSRTLISSQTSSTDIATTARASKRGNTRHCKLPVFFFFISSLSSRKYIPFRIAAAMSKSQNRNDDMMKSVKNLTQQLHTMTYREMQKLCKQSGLPANGTKEVVQSRLLEFLSTCSESSSNNSSSFFMDKDRVPLQNNVSSVVQTAATAVKEETMSIITTFSSPSKTTLSTNVSSPPSSRKKQKIMPGTLEPPENWEVIYSIVEELRADRSAPLDTDGGEAIPERHLGEKVYRFQVLVALMLSSQTKDAVVGETMRILQKHGLTVSNIHATDAVTLNTLIQKVGFHNNKTKYLKQVAEILVRDYDSDIPPTAQEMMALPGIGPKMAYIIENVAFGRSTGIGVDTHMHRIFNDLKWVKSKTPEQTREQLEGWLPPEKWGEVNMLWVGFGQESQQQKEKIIKKALKCSRPAEALKLLQTVGVNVVKEAKKFDMEQEVQKFFRDLS